jgi:hypothetical protein
MQVKLRGLGLQGHDAIIVRTVEEVLLSLDNLGAMP